MESRAGFLLLKEEQKLEKEMNGYMNWICKAGSGTRNEDCPDPPSVVLTQSGQRQDATILLLSLFLAHNRTMEANHAKPRPS